MPTAPRPHRARQTPTHAVYDRFRGSSSQRGYTSKWAAYASCYKNDHAMCLACGGPSEEVDHIIPHEGDQDPLFWDETNHQPLCKSCHSAKTNRCDGGHGNARDSSTAVRVCAIADAWYRERGLLPHIIGGRRKGESHDRSAHRDT